jgi:glutamate N-acetyltransferase / amino-acid N-acetyltransferase
VSVTYPAGFRAAGITAGFKRSGRSDFALLTGDAGTTAAGLFTTNLVQAAPVRLSRERLRAGRAGAVIVNSGQANAATGEQGDRDARAATLVAADHLRVDPDVVLQCSTGVIGEPLPMDALLGALPALVSALSPDGGPDFARAILTTDTVPKEATADGDGIRVGGAAKGVGMISPNLATMLVFVTTDAAVERTGLQRLAEEQLKPRFNALTVDGCTSTNDTVLLFASGAAVEREVLTGTRAWDGLAAAIGEVGESLVRQLIADGEGVGHVLLIEVAGARSDTDADRIAKAVADSPLVKTAAFGGDPNPGRILQAVGSSGVQVEPGAVDVALGDTAVVEGGTIPPAYFAGDGLADAARRAMGGPEIHVRISVGGGAGTGRAIGGDLSYDYVRINGEYTT